MESSFTTIDDADHLSIEYKNIYVINGMFTYLMVENMPIPLSAKTFTDTSGWIPYIKMFKDEDSLNAYVKSLRSIQRVELAALGDNWWYGNIGHALFDGLYPIYLALVKFGYAHQPFVILSDNLDNKSAMAYDVLERFSGKPVIERYKINPREVICFETLVTGTGNAGNRVINETYTLYGRNYNAIRLFKERMLSTYNANFDKPINTIPNVIVINNKRFSDEERNVINSAIEHFKDSVNIRFIDWYHDIPAFEDQMKLIQDVDVQVTGPGTAMMYTPFLKRHAVNVNLGYMEHTHTGGRGNIQIPGTEKDFAFPGWMEQAVCAGADYVNTLYYDRAKYNNLELQPLIEIIERAINLAKSKTLTYDNHNTDAKIFIEYCKHVSNAKQICQHLTGVAYFIELFVNEHPLAAPDHLTNFNLLRAIKDQYRYDRRYEIRLE